MFPKILCSWMPWPIHFSTSFVSQTLVYQTDVFFHHYSTLNLMVWKLFSFSLPNCFLNIISPFNIPSFQTLTYLWCCCRHQSELKGLSTELLAKLIPKHARKQWPPFLAHGFAALLSSKMCIQLIYCPKSQRVLWLPCPCNSRDCNIIT